MRPTSSAIRHQADGNYKLPSCKQQPASSMALPAPLYDTHTHTHTTTVYFNCQQVVSCYVPVVLFPAAYQASICSNYAETGAILGASHSNSYSRLSRLDFLCLTSPKMPPRCLYPPVFFPFFTQLLHGWVPPFPAACENENTAARKKKQKKTDSMPSVSQQRDAQSICQSVSQRSRTFLHRWSCSTTTTTKTLHLMTSSSVQVCRESGTRQWVVICRLRRFLLTCRQTAVSL